MFYIGCHLSSAKGFLAMGKDAEKIGATTFQFFTRNPRGGSAKPLDHEDIQAFLKLKEELGIGTLVAHAPYTLNGCSADEKIRDFAKRTMADDLERMEAIPGNLYNFHPGSHVKQGVEAGITYIAEMLNEILRPDLHTTVLLETMAGKGSEVGRSFEELREILDRVELSDKMGVCMDTCHVWDAGYDIVNDLDGVLAEFDRGSRPSESGPFERQHECAGSRKGPPRADRGRRDRCGGACQGDQPSGAARSAVLSGDSE